jgi:hypothetical protein
MGMGIQIRPPAWKDDDVGYYRGEVEVSSPNKIIAMPTGFIQARIVGLPEGTGAQLDFLGIRKGQLAYINFKDVKWLDALAAKWLSDRGIIDLSQMSLEALHYMGEFRRVLNAK